MLAYLKQAARDRLPLQRTQLRDTRAHLDAAAQWLMRAFELDGSGGIPHSYDLRHRARGRPYPETTGYIIPTFFDYAGLFGHPEYAIGRSAHGRVGGRDTVPGWWCPSPECSTRRVPTRRPFSIPDRCFLDCRGHARRRV